MKKREVDVILCPTHPGAGALSGTPKYWNYTAIWNILDQPSLVLPSGLKCDKRMDFGGSENAARSDEDMRERQACESKV